MPEFTYVAVDPSGKSANGSISAKDSAEAAIKVRALGVYPTRIETGNGSRHAENGAGAERKNGAGTSEKAVNAQTGKITRLQVLLFTREMADLLDAGLPMDRAFSVLLDQADQEGIRGMLASMQGDIRAGQPLSDALKKFPKQFPMLYSNMVRAGEISGQLASVMLRLADFMEKEQVRRSQVMAALTYPMVLVSVAILAIIFLLTFVIPKLAGVFNDMKASLPLPTVMLLGASGFIAHYWWAIIITIGAAVIGFRAWVKTPAGNRTFDAFRLGLPILGPLTLKIVSGRLVRTLGTLLGGGVPILDAMDIASSALGNMVATEAILAARSAVRQGETLHQALESVALFPPVVKHMTAVGEETGRLSQMLLRTADTLDFEVDNIMRRMTSLVEPLVVLFMGGFVGFVVLSILLPIFNANSLVK